MEHFWQGSGCLLAHNQWSFFTSCLSAQAQQRSLFAGMLPRIVQIHVWKCGCWVEFDPRGSPCGQREGGVQPSAALQGHAQHLTSEVAEPSALHCPAAVLASSDEETLPVLRPLVWFKFFTQEEAMVGHLPTRAHQVRAEVDQTLSALS